MFAWQIYFLIQEIWRKMANMTVWAQRHISRIESDFDAADNDKSGSLQFSEVFALLQKSGFKGSEEEAKRIFKELDVDKNNVISRSEFSKAMSKVPKIDFKQIVLRRAFRKLDKDGSGFLTRDEILDATTNECGLNISAEKIADLEIFLVKDDDKKIDYEEFLSQFNIKSTASTMRTLFEKLDADKSGKLNRREILDGLQKDEELHLQAPKISEILIKWCKGADAELDYGEFVRAYEGQR